MTEDDRIFELIDACRFYFEKTGREITVEYVLLRDVNDSERHAYRLGRIVKKMRSNVNLIVYNPVPGLPFEQPSEQSVDRFLTTLRTVGINAHVRRSRGSDIDAACGQLRRKTSG